MQMRDNCRVAERDACGLLARPQLQAHGIKHRLLPLRFSCPLDWWPQARVRGDNRRRRRGPLLLAGKRREPA
jgi:hypothetical protein